MTRAIAEGDTIGREVEDNAKALQVASNMMPQEFEILPEKSQVMI